MKTKLTRILLICALIFFILFNIGLLSLYKLQGNELNNTKQRVMHLENVEIIFDLSKEISAIRFKYEQYDIGDSPVYWGSDKNTVVPLRSIADQPKLVIGLNRNMCSPCVEGVYAEIREVFPDFESNPNILCIADIEERFKDDYYGKKVISFSEKEVFPLYEINAMPYFFILDKDLCVKQLFVTDKASPELTNKYLSAIKDRYFKL